MKLRACTFKMTLWKNPDTFSGWLHTYRVVGGRVVAVVETEDGKLHTPFVEDVVMNKAPSE
jgi:hypothetical protein